MIITGQVRIFLAKYQMKGLLHITMKLLLKHLFCVIMTLSLFLSAVSCTDEKPEDSKPYVSASSFRIVRSDKSSDKLTAGIKTFRSKIQEYTGAKLDYVTDYTEANLDGETPVKEIIIGDTTRKASVDCITALKDSKTKNEYMISYDGENIVITGESDDAVMYGMREFLCTYVIPSGNNGNLLINESISTIASIPSQLSMLDNLYIIETGHSSIIQSVSTSGVNKWPTYGRVIELKHNGDNNGLLMATSQWAGTTFPVYTSENGGKSWRLINQVSEEFDSNIVANWQPELFELPCDLGDMKEGTILLAGCSHSRDPVDVTKMCIWRSTDLGKTWEEFTVVDEGKGTETKEGLYEPVLICDEDGTLVCFYSDESEVSSVQGQRLVFKTSKDGINWSEKQYCVAPTDRSMRPGMVSVAKMGDHGYIMVYELLGPNSGGGGPVYYKVSDSLTEWDYKTVGTRLISDKRYVSGHTPYCTWTPDGGEYGTVIAAGRCGGTGSTDYKIQSKLFLSFDLGETWTVMDNPLIYDYKEGFEGPNYAYSFGFSVGSDGSIYHINNVFPKTEQQIYKSADLQFVKIKITGFEE